MNSMAFEQHGSIQNLELFTPNASETRRKRNAHYSSQLAKCINATIEKNRKAEAEGLNSLPCRYIVAVLCFLCVFVLSAQRISITFAIRAMLNPIVMTQISSTLTDDSSAELCPASSNVSFYTTNENIEMGYDWTPKQMTYALVSNYVSYAVFLIPAGRLNESWNCKSVLNLSVLFSSICNLILPWSCWWSVYCFIAVNFLKGMTQAAILPAVNCFISNWFSLKEKNLATSLIYSGGCFGSLLGDVLLGILRYLEFFIGWPIAFYVLGVMGCICSILLTLILYDTPENHPTITRKELKFITRNKKKVNFPKLLLIPWKEMCTSPSAMALHVLSFGQYWVAVYFLNIHPIYIVNMLHFTIWQKSLYTVLPYVPQFVVLVSAGYFSDFLISRKYATVTTTRKIIISISCILYSSCFIGLCFARCEKWINSLFSVIAMAAMGLMPSGIIILPTDIAPTFAGSFTGICNTAGVLSAAVLPLVTGTVVGKEQTLKEWREVFLITTGVTIMCGVIFLLFGTAETQPWNYPVQHGPKPLSTIYQTVNQKRVKNPKIFEKNGNIIHCTHL